MKTVTPLLMGSVGILIIVIAVIISLQQKTWIEQEITVKTIEGTKGRNAAIGGVIGGVGGAAAGAAVGGIGIALCGTGVGIPAGVVCISLALLGGATGAAVGSATGDPTTQVEEMIPIEKTGAAYSTWIWVVLLLIGISLVIYAIYIWRKSNSSLSR